MKISGFSDFRKLWGKIEEDLEENTDYWVLVQNNYDSYDF